MTLFHSFLLYAIISQATPTAQKLLAHLELISQVPSVALYRAGPHGQALHSSQIGRFNIVPLVCASFQPWQVRVGCANG